MTLTQREREAAERFDAMVRDVLSGKIMATVGDSIRLAQAVTALKSGSQLARVEELAVTAEEVFMACDWSSQENWDRIKSNPFNTATYERMAKRLTDLIRAKLAEEKEKTDG